MADVVMDASAVLARLLDEPGRDIVLAAIDGAYLCTVNLTEVAQRLVDLDGDDSRVGETIRELPCRIIAFDRDMAIQAGLLRRTTKANGLSLGDRACLALGKRLGLPVYTADRAWAELDLGVEVVLIR